MTKTPDQTFAELEKSGWADAETAQAYATDFAKAAEYSIPIMMAQLGVGPGYKLLDLCCGHGILAEAAASLGADVTGLDFSPAMLDLARARVPNARFQQGDAMALPFEAGMFDAVSIGFGIPHVPDPPRVFAEVRRVLKPGGRLAYSVWQDRAGALKYVFDAIGQQGMPGVALPPGPGAHDFAEPERARAALDAAGFSGVTLIDVDSRWIVSDPVMPCRFFEEGTVRGGALLRAQPDPNLHAIRDAVRARVLAEHGQGPNWDIPIPSVVVSAQASG